MENMVLCGSTSYEKKYYLNPKFNGLPVEVKKELQVMCVTFTEEVGGIFMLEFKPDGKLIIRVESMEADAGYDEIGCDLKVKQIQSTRGELFSSLELYNKILKEAEKN